MIVRGAERMSGSDPSRRNACPQSSVAFRTLRTWRDLLLARPGREWPFATCGPETVVGRLRCKADSRKSSARANLRVHALAVNQDEVVCLLSSEATAWRAAAPW